MDSCHHGWSLFFSNMQGAEYFCIKEENQKEKRTTNTAQNANSHTQETHQTEWEPVKTEKNSATKSGLVDDGLICPCL